MAEYLTPGIYVEEFDSAETPMTSVSTSTASFIGMTEKGPQYGVPVLITNFASFRRVFGNYLTEREFGEYRYLTYAVNQFFTNGGSRCYVKRVVPSDAFYSCSEEKAPVIFYTKETGEWGNKITITITESSQYKTQILEKVQSNPYRYRVKNTQGFSVGDIVFIIKDEQKFYNKVIDVDDTTIIMEQKFAENIDDMVPQLIVSVSQIDIHVKYDMIEEKYEHCSLNRNSYDFIEEDKRPNNRTGLQSFIDNNEVNLLVIPGMTDAQIVSFLIAHCENMENRFAILDIPREKKIVNDIVEYRNLFDSDFAAMYHPWVKVSDPITKNTITTILPSGSVSGVYAKTDNKVY